MGGTGPEGFERKVNRALEHMHALHHEIYGGVDGDSKLITFHEQPDGVTEAILGELPEQFSVLVGDALQNLRAALDHLVFDLMLTEAGSTPIPARVIKKSQFPIFGEEAMTTGQQKDAIGWVNKSAQTIIKDLQPNRPGNDYRTDPLWLLHDLARIDRHRALLPAFYAGTGLGIGGGNAHYEFVEHIGGAQEPGAVIARFKIAGPSDPTRPMDVHLGFEPAITFADGPCQGREALKVLAELHSYVVKEVIPPLIPFLSA